jgi:hypothetical protein
MNATNDSQVLFSIRNIPKKQLIWSAFLVNSFLVILNMKLIDLRNLFRKTVMKSNNASIWHIYSNDLWISCSFSIFWTYGLDRFIVLRLVILQPYAKDSFEFIFSIL